MRIKILSLAALVVTCFSFASCDDTTDQVGGSITDASDLLDVTPGTYGVSSESFIADSVLSRSTTGYLGKIRDPETGAYVTGDFMAQFSTLENYEFPSKDSLVTVVDGQEVVGKDICMTADSCSIRLFYTSYYGDSLATMNITAHEMKAPMSEGKKYYSNFDPMDSKYDLVRTDSKALKVNKTYTLADLTLTEDERGESSFVPNIKINLNKPYTDENNIVYNNYGTYIMKKFYEDPENFKNPYNFIHRVCPGFYFKVNDGLGSMAYVTISQLNVYFKYRSDSTLVGAASFAGTEEVLQTTNITNDKGRLQELANDPTCTYLKTPAGIFTVLELPIDSIKLGHENDTINSAKVTIARLNDTKEGLYKLDPPTTLLMIPKDSIYSFFENADILDNKKSFLATYSSNAAPYNSYTFNNISGMVSYMYGIKEAGMAADPNWLDNHKDWNKVVLIPVSTTTNTSGQVVKVVHDMSLTSTRLVRGTKDKATSPIKIDVIYSKFVHD